MSASSEMRSRKASRRRLVAERLVELAADADELLEVLDAALRLDRPLGSQRVHVAGLGEHLLDQVADLGARVDALAQPLHRRHEAVDRLVRGGAEPGDVLGHERDVEDGLAHRVRVGDDAGLGRVADPAPRRVDRALEGEHVARVDEQVQVGDSVLDLGAVVELGAADHLVVDVVRDEDVLEQARHGVGPVEDGHLVARGARVDEPLDLRRDPARLLAVTLELPDLDLVALFLVGPEVLLEAAAVVLDDRVGGVEDRLSRAVVLLELDDAGVGEVLLEVEDVADVRAAPAVDRVVGDDAVGDEVVGALDVDVVDRLVELDEADGLDSVVAAVLGEHRHAGLDR